MAFKILSANEIELLTDNQRMQYESELAIYNERVKFVEQMEKFENTVIEPYEPKLTYISAIGIAPEKEFAKPEYVVTTIDPIAKPEPKLVSVDFDEPVTAVLPKRSKIKNVQVDHIKKAEQSSPILPQIRKTRVPAKLFASPKNRLPVLPVNAKTNIPGKTFKKSERVKPKLPTAAKPRNFSDLLFASVAIDSKSIKASKPNHKTPRIDLPIFSAPESTKPILPKSAVDFSEIKAFEMPGLTAFDMPKAAIPQPVNVSFKQANKTKAVLPEVLNISPVNVSFSKPEIKSAELPIAAKTQIPAKQFTKTEHAVSDLPAVSILKKSIAAYTVPKQQKASLPTFIKPKTISAFDGWMEPSVAKIEIDYPTIAKPSIETYEKITSKASGLPSRANFTIPTAETFRQLLKAEKSKAKEGANA